MRTMTSQSRRSASKVKSSETAAPPQNAATIRLATWNVDGLCERHLHTRSRESARLLRASNADVIFLQEVVDESQTIFDAALGKAYRRVVDRPSEGMPYYTLAFVRKDHAIVGVPRRKAFTGHARSGMGRDLLVFDVNCHGVLTRCVTSHLESMKPSGAQRVAQLAQIAAELHSFNGPGLCGGDFNMRDTEQKMALATHPLTDAYFHFGRPKHARATWVMPGRPQVTCRFDRVYCTPRFATFVPSSAAGERMDASRHSGGSGRGNVGRGRGSSGEAAQRDIVMLGTRELDSIEMTPSDHMGMVLSVKVWNSPSSAALLQRKASSAGTAGVACDDHAAAAAQVVGGRSTVGLSPREAMRAAALAREAERRARAKAKQRKRCAEAASLDCSATSGSGTTTETKPSDGEEEALTILQAIQQRNHRAIEAQVHRNREKRSRRQEKESERRGGCTAAAKAEDDETVIDLT